MNPHFQPYSELVPPHSPSPDDRNYTVLNDNDNGESGAAADAASGTSSENDSSTCLNPSNGIGNSIMHQQENHNQQISINNNNPHNFHQFNINNNPIKHCAGCGGKIVERYLLLALDRFWHNSCLKCYCCGVMLADIGTSCFTRSGMILCRSDYTRMFGSTASCSACRQTIAANEFVMRTTIPIVNNQQQHQNQHQHQSSPILENHHQKHFIGGQLEHHVFHLKCFSCSKCASQLRPGDRYYMLGGNLVCEQDWNKLMKNSSSINTPVRKGKVGRPRRSKD